MRLPTHPLIPTILLAAGAQAAPAIDALSVSRSGNDLVIAWTPPATPVDGYRVYRSDVVDCATDTRVYEGAAPTWTAAGALADPTLALYRVASFVGTDEGPPTTPVYKYSISVPPGLSNAVNGVMISLPPATGPADVQQLCGDLNGAYPATSPVHVIVRWDGRDDRAISSPCNTPLRPFFQVVPTEAYLIKQTVDVATPVVLWGHGHPEWRIDLPEVRVLDPVSPGRMKNLYWVSLPYDHDYPDLAAVATDIPAAVEVRVWDPTSTDPSNLGYGVGLSRPSSSDPWTGPNATLDDRRGEGIMVAVDVPTSWAPRRLCTGPIVHAPHRNPAMRTRSSVSSPASALPASSTTNGPAVPTGGER